MWRVGGGIGPGKTRVWEGEVCEVPEKRVFQVEGG